MLPLGLALSLACCKRGNLDVVGLIASQSPDVNKRFAVSQKYNATHPARSYQAGSDNYRLFMCTDVHVVDVTTELDRFVSDVLADTDHAPVVLCLGDLQSSYGYLPTFMEHVKPILDSPVDTLLSVPGNHDLYYGLWDEYLKYFGTGSYYFYIETPTKGRDLFLCMDSASGVMGRKQRDWVEKVLKDNADCRHKVVCTHTHFFKRDGSQEITDNYPLEETHELFGLFSRCGVDYVMTGHDHYLEETLYKGIMFRTYPSMKHTDPTSWYSIMTFREDGRITGEDIQLR